VATETQMSTILPVQFNYECPPPCEEFTRRPP